jgi:hypothetical protein
VGEGLVDLDATVLSYFPEWDGRVTDPRSRSTRVRHVAAMASGHAEETIDRAIEAGHGDMALGLLLLPPEFEPGTHFAYNQPCTNALAAVIERVSGEPLIEFLRPRLFEPLGIESYGWWPDPIGRAAGFSGLHATTETVAKLGQLYLDDGRWQGRQLLPAGWAGQVGSVQVPTGGEVPDWSLGYGFQFWQSRYGYRGDGAYGQFMVILPEADAVVAITSQSPDMQGVLDALWQHLLPALTAGSGSSGAWPSESPQLAGPAGDGSTGSLAGATYRPGPDNAVDAVRSVWAGPGELRIDDGTELAAALGGPDGWTVSGPVATAYAWSRGRLLVDVLLVEGPHRLHLTLDPATGTFAARWQTEPLGRWSLARLRMPRP